MKPALQLSRLRLINWHNFIDETIAVEGSLFLIGDNGSGKTTLLDAVHSALTGDWKVELNAAARVVGRRGEGRSLQGLVLGHDVERGFRRPEGAVAYAALELREPSGNGRTPRENVISMGIGIYVASPDSRPEKWGFLTSGPLDEVPLTRDLGSPGDDRAGREGPGPRRPLDRAELAAAMPAGQVMDIGRYRTRAGEKLFGSREKLEQVATFLHAGKAYRELVSKTANFSELISELLPRPDLETFHEVRRALEAIERTRSDLVSLEQELARLRDLLFWKQEVEKERETIARDEYLTSLHQLDLSRREVDRLAGLQTEAEKALSRLEGLKRDREALLSSQEEELGRIRAGGGLEIVERHREALRLAGLRRRTLESAEQRLRELEGEEAHRVREKEESESALARWAEETLSRLKDRMDGITAGVVDAESGPLPDLFRHLEGAGESGGKGPVDFAGADECRKRLRLDLGAQAARRRERQQGDRREAAGRLREARALLRRRRRLVAQGESDPPLPGLPEAIEMLAKAGIEGVPLYRLLEPGASLGTREAGLIEQALGRKLLGTLIVPGNRHAEALSLVLRHAPGIPLADPAGADAQLRTALRGPGGAPRVSDLLEVAPSDPAATAYLQGHVGDWLWIAEDAESVPPQEGASYLDAAGRLHASLRAMGLRAERPVWLGGRARRMAWQAELDGLEAEIGLRRERADALKRAARESGRIAARMEEAVRFLEEIDLLAAASLANRRDELSRMLDRLSEEQEERRRERELLARELEALEREAESLATAVRERGLESLADRIRELEGQVGEARRALDSLNEEVGGGRERRLQLGERLDLALARAGECEGAARKAREVLTLLVPEENRGDLDDYVMRIRRGARIKPENLAAHREESVRRLAAHQERIQQGEGIRHALLWQKHAFRYDPEANTLMDSAGRDIELVTDELQGQVDELTSALRGRNEELLERVVLQELVGALRREVGNLETTVRGVNQLMGDLVFGRSRFRIEQRLKPEMSRLNRLLREASSLSPESREELRDYFAARLDEFTDPTGENLPPVLDYRQWYDFHLRMATLDGEGVELSQERLRQGSGGEQAVPSYLLLFCMTMLLYDEIGAQARLLILDEAFYGIDAGRRNELLRFCGRAGIDLVVATPEVDGVTEALPASTTVLIEKTREGDVFLFDLRYRQTTPTLFDSGEPSPESFVLGAPPEDQAEHP